MTGEALVCRLKNLEPIEDADNLLQADMYGETIIVSKDHEEKELGLLFDCDTQLSHEFCHANNLYRHSNLNKDQDAKGYFDDNRRVRAIKLRGVKCTAFWMPFSSLENMFPEDTKLKLLSEGAQISEYMDIPLCNKYVRKSNQTEGSRKNKKKKASLADLVPTFYEHFKTAHFFKHPEPAQEGDIVIITEKLHGTSCRCGNLRVNKKHGKILTWLFKALRIKTSEEFKFVVGSRRVVKSLDGQEREGVNHYYEEDLWTKASNENFRGKLKKGETVFFEIVGYTPNGSPIMGTHGNSKLKNFMEKDEYNEFIDKYGEQTIFNYGCTDVPMEIHDYKGAEYEMTYDPVHGHANGLRITKDSKETRYKTPQYKVFVYRITHETPDGTIDLSWDQIKRRCQEMNVEHVPELRKDLICESGDKLYLYKDTNKGETHSSTPSLEDIVKELTEEGSKNFPQHIREGVCVRVEDGSLTPNIYKHKSYLFKVLEGIIKDKEDYVDIEEDN